MRPDESLECLREGNTRFCTQGSIHPRIDLEHLAETAKSGQHPIAAVVGCSDSRVPVELLFDQGVGDLFVIRVAGNVCGTHEVASIEYAVDHLDAPLVVVLGHTLCGAVTAVATGAELSRNLRALVDPIRPALNQARRAHPDLQGEALVPATVEMNVWQSIEDLLKESSPVRRGVAERTVKVIGAIYDIATGKVHWLGKHPRQKELVGP